MENYIALLLLIVPGFVARKIYKQTTDIRDDLSQFEESLYCLLNSTIITAIAASILYFRGYRPLTINALYGNIQFIAVYAALVFVLSIVLGFTIKPALCLYNKLINICRGKSSDDIVISKTIFDMAFNDGKTHLVEVYKDGKFLGRGVLSANVEKYKELYLEDVEEEYADLLQTVGSNHLPYIGTYIDGKTGLVIKEIDTNA